MPDNDWNREPQSDAEIHRHDDNGCPFCGESDDYHRLACLALQGNGGNDDSNV